MNVALQGVEGKVTLVAHSVNATDGLSGISPCILVLPIEAVPFYKKYGFMEVTPPRLLAGEVVGVSSILLGFGAHTCYHASGSEESSR